MSPIKVRHASALGRIWNKITSVQGVKTNDGMGYFYPQGTGLCSLSAKVIIQSFLEKVGNALLTSFT